MINYFMDIAQNNEFAQGVLIAGPTTAFLYLARNVPLKAWSLVKHHFSYSLTFKSDMDKYGLVSKFVLDNVVKERFSRKYSYDEVSLWDEETASEQAAFSGASIGYGVHWGTYNGSLVRISRQMQEDNQTITFKETLELQFIGRNSNNITKFCEELSDSFKKQIQTETLNVKVNGGDYWIKSSKIPKRSIESVFVEEKVDQFLLEKVHEFSNRKEEYLAKGLPWHMGILLTGIPGTGKTSLIHAIASETERDIVFLNLSALKSDKELMSLMAGRMDWSNVILVLEDIDVSRVATDRENESETVSLSTLLNMLDGLTTPQGMITIATTNHPDKLDPALTRSGRFDHVVELKKLKWIQFIEMARLLRNDYKEDQEGWEMLCTDYVPTEGAILREWLLNEDLDFIKKKFLP